MSEYERRANAFLEDLQNWSLNQGHDLETFYRGIAEIRDVFKERLEAAHDELPLEVADEVTGGF